MTEKSTDFKGVDRGTARFKAPLRWQSGYRKS